jgi:hypothetical protein
MNSELTFVCQSEQLSIAKHVMLISESRRIFHSSCFNNNIVEQLNAVQNGQNWAGYYLAGRQMTTTNLASDRPKL